MAEMIEEVNLDEFDHLDCFHRPKFLAFLAPRLM